MPEQQSQVNSGETGGIRRKTAVALASVLAITGCIADTLGKPNQDGVQSTVPIRTEAQPKRMEFNLLDWYRMPREAQEAMVLLLEGGDVTLNNNTPDLRLHTKLINPDHVLMDLNIPLDKEPLPPAGPNYSGIPVEMRLTTEQFTALKNQWRTIADANNDILVPVGTKLSVKPQQLPRGDSSTEISTQLVFQGFTPLSQ